MAALYANPAVGTRTIVSPKYEHRMNCGRGSSCVCASGIQRETLGLGRIAGGGVIAEGAVGTRVAGGGGIAEGTVGTRIAGGMIGRWIAGVGCKSRSGCRRYLILDILLGIGH